MDRDKLRKPAILLNFGHLDINFLSYVLNDSAQMFVLNCRNVSAKF